MTDSVHSRLRREDAVKRVALQLRAATPGSTAEQRILALVDQLSLSHDEFIRIFSIGNLQEPRQSQLKRLLEDRMVDALTRHISSGALPPAP